MRRDPKWSQKATKMLAKNGAQKKIGLQKVSALGSYGIFITIWLKVTTRIDFGCYFRSTFHHRHQQKSMPKCSIETSCKIIKIMYKHDATKTLNYLCILQELKACQLCKIVVFPIQELDFIKSEISISLLFH